MAERLHARKALGVRLAIDDFGTGFSSLGYLERLPVDVIKIDRSFVDGLDRLDARTALVKTIIKLSETLGLDTVAEGVETAGQLQSLRTMGCQFAQGYLFAKPLEAGPPGLRPGQHPNPILRRIRT